MTYLATQPQLISEAAAEVAGIRTAIAEANAAVAAPTTGVAAAASDEVSAAVARMFGAYAQEYQAVVGQTTAFHDQFVRALAAAGSAYAQAEAANAAAVSQALGAITTPIQSLLGPAPTTGAAGWTATASPLMATTYDVALIMTGSGTAIPTPEYMASVRPYITANFTVTGASLPLDTPEGLYPITGVKDLPLTRSVDIGLSILDTALFGPDGLITAQGQSVAVLGYSQSSIISSLEMRHLASLGSPHTDALSFTLLGNPMNPNGGLLARFPGLTMPALGLEFYGATPADTGYPTDIYTRVYDGFADFPRYPLNALSVFNAMAGIAFVHTDYGGLDPTNLPPDYDLVQLPTSPGYGGDTRYFMITHPDLPLLEPVRWLPVVGDPLADLVQPNLTYLINLGYGDPRYGYSTDYADVPTPFGLFPPIDPVAFAGYMVSGTQQGITDFASHFATPALPSVPQALSELSQTNSSSLLWALPGAPPSTGTILDVINALKTANTNITTAVSSVAANSYAIALPTTDIANTLVTALPSYNVNLFLDGIAQIATGDPVGGLVSAIGDPIAASVALVAFAGGLEFLVLLRAVASIASDITGLG